MEAYESRLTLGQLETSHWPGLCHLWALHRSRAGSHGHVRHRLGKLCWVLELWVFVAVEAADNFDLTRPVEFLRSVLR